MFPSLLTVARSVRAGAALALLIAAAGARQGAAQPVFLAPGAGEPVVGETAIEVDCAGFTDWPLELRVDGETLVRWSGSPCRFSHDFGTSGTSRRLEVVAAGAAMSAARLVAELETVAVRIDDVVDLELQQFYVAVEGRRRGRLEAADFQVLDDGRRQQIVTFADGGIAVTATLLIDVSDSMRGRRLEAALRACREFAAAMEEGDEAQLVAFADRRVWSAPVGDAQRLLAAIDDFEAHSSSAAESPRVTAVHDAVHRTLAALESRQGRRVLVLLSDGWDLSSVLDPTQLADTVRQSRSSLHWIRLAGDEPTAQRRPRQFDRSDPRRRDAFVATRFLPAPSSWRTPAESLAAWRRLGELVTLSGGRTTVVDRVDELPRELARLLGRLHDEVALGWYPITRRGRGAWHEVDIRWTDGSLRGLITREGYVER